MRDAAPARGSQRELSLPKFLSIWQRARQEKHPVERMARAGGIAASRELSRLVAVIVTVVVITTLYLAKTVILPLALALLLSFVLAPVVTCLERLRVPRTPGRPYRRAGNGRRSGGLWGGQYSGS